MLLLGVGLPACESGPEPVPTPSADEKPVTISTVAILALPNWQVLPTWQDQIQEALAAAIKTRYHLPTLYGRALSAAVWRELDDRGEACTKAYRDKVSEGMTAVGRLQVTRALDLLEQAGAHLPYCGSEVRDSAALVNLHLGKGLALLSRGAAEAAEAEFRLAVSLDNGLSAAPDLFHKDQAAAFERAKKQLLSGNPTKVELLSWPEGASVIIDGRPAGTCPVIAPLFPGQHFLRVELAGHAPWTLNLPDDLPPASIKAWLFPVLAGEPPRALLATALAGESLPDSAREQLLSIAKLLQVDALLLTALENRDGQIQLSIRLTVPAGRSAGEVRVFNLGSSPKDFGKRIETVARTLKQLEPKPVKVEQKKPAKAEEKKPAAEKKPAKVEEKKPDKTENKKPAKLQLEPAPPPPDEKP
jgi:hypothetical protein